jgi:release factor glutamine methyltransferase
MLGLQFHWEFVILNKNNDLTVIQAYQYLLNDLRPLYDQRELSSIFRLILEDIGFGKDVLLLRPDTKLSDRQENRIVEIINDLEKEKPIQYILGYAWFYEKKFLLEKGVLIPRPETEELVDLIIKENTRTNPTIIDIGTGSGCIALSLSMNIPGAQLTAMDYSENALNIAKENADFHHLDIKFILDDILNPNFSLYSESFDIVVSNPPYVRLSEKMWMKKNVTDYEPEMALYVSDVDPLIYYRKTEEFCSKKLMAKGLIYLEINEYLGNETAAIFVNKNYSSVDILNDLQGKNRFLKIQK